MLWTFMPLKGENGLIARTNATAQFIPNKSLAWLDDESVKRLRFFTLNLIKTASAAAPEKAMRKAGSVPVCTHYIETADLAINLGSQMLNLPANVVAFAAYAHDLIEDFPDQLPKEDPAHFIVTQCWRGDARYRAVLTSTIALLTDNPALRDEDRLWEQVAIANDPQAPLLVSLIRFCDKLGTLGRDYTTLLRGEMPFGNEAEFRAYFAKRSCCVQAMERVSPRLKRWYGRLLARVEAELCQQDDFPRRCRLAQEGHPLRNDFLDPISFVMRSTSDNKEVQEKMRPLSSLKALWRPCKTP